MPLHHSHNHFVKESLQLEIIFSDSGQIPLGSIPANYTITQLGVALFDFWSGTDPTFSIGTAASPQLLVPQGVVALDADLGWKSHNVGALSTGADLIVEIDPKSSFTGDGRIFLEYIADLSVLLPPP